MLLAPIILHVLPRLNFYWPVTGQEAFHSFYDYSGNLVGDLVVLTGLGMVDDSPLLDVQAQRNSGLEHVVSLNKSCLGKTSKRRGNYLVAKI